MYHNHSKKGFTIIEVALVLAIAGLIFLMVFIALPAVQRTQRDAERRDDMGTLMKAIQNFQTKNRGALPDDLTGSNTIVTWSDAEAAEMGDTTWAAMYKDFLGQDFADPLGPNLNYVLEIRECGTKNTAAVADTDAPNRCESDDVDTRDFKENAYKVLIVKRATCDGAWAVASNNPRKVAVVYKLEGSGSYCISTQ